MLNVGVSREGSALPVLHAAAEMPVVPTLQRAETLPPGSPAASEGAKGREGGHSPDLCLVTGSG